MLLARFIITNCKTEESAAVQYFLSTVLVSLQLYLSVSPRAFPRFPSRSSTKPSSLFRDVTFNAFNLLALGCGLSGGITYGFLSLKTRIRQTMETTYNVARCAADEEENR